MRRFIPVLIVLIVMGLMLPFTAAQVSGDTPQPVREAAITHLQSVFPGIGRPTSWRHVGPFTALSNNLGCRYVVGTPLAQSTGAYQVFLNYEGVEYEYYVSSDATQVIPCDPKIPGVGAVTTPIATAPAAICRAVAATGSTPIYLQTTVNSQVLGYMSAATGADPHYTVVGRNADGQWYLVQIKGTSGVGWVQLSQIVLSGDCSTAPVNNPAAVATPVTAGACTLTSPRGNIRQSPSTEATIVGTLTEGATGTAIGRTDDSSWYQIQFTTAAGTLATGWIADVASEATGSGCATLPVTGTTVQDFGTCPPDYAGYMQPRLAIGAAAQVEAGGVPNRVRQEPTTSASILFEMQPGTEFQVIGGPACGNDIVWWEISQNGRTGWTAESNRRDNAYYVKLVSAPVAAPAAAAAPTGGRINSGYVMGGNVGLVEQVEVGAINEATDLAWVPGSNRLAIIAADGVKLLDATTWQSVDPALETELLAAQNFEPTALAVSPDGSLMAVGFSSGNIRMVLLGAGGSATVMGGMAAHSSPVTDLAFSPDGVYLLSAGTANTISTEQSIQLWDVDSLNIRTGQMSQVFATELDLAPLAIDFTAAGIPVILTPDSVRAYSLRGAEMFRQTRTSQAGGALLGADPAWDNGNQNLILYSDGNTIMSMDITASTAAPTPRYTLNATAIEHMAQLAPENPGFDIPVLAVYASQESLPEGSGLALFVSADTSSLIGFPLEPIRGLAFSPDGTALAVALDNVVYPDQRPGLWLFGTTE